MKVMVAQYDENMEEYYAPVYYESPQKYRIDIVERAQQAHAMKARSFEMAGITYEVSEIYARGKVVWVPLVLTLEEWWDAEVKNPEQQEK